MLSKHSFFDSGVMDSDKSFEKRQQRGFLFIGEFAYFFHEQSVQSLKFICFKHVPFPAEQFVQADSENIGKPYDHGKIRFACSRFIITYIALGGRKLLSKLRLCQMHFLPQLPYHQFHSTKFPSSPIIYQKNF